MVSLHMILDPEPDLLRLVIDVARLLRVEADKRARVHGMTLGQWSLLSRLSQHPGLSQKELADLMEVEPISVARMVDRLEAVGLLERRADRHDRRVWRLHLLPGAQPILRRMTAVREEVAALVLQNIAPPAREAILQGLIQMKSELSNKAGNEAGAAEPMPVSEPSLNASITEDV